MYLKHHKSYKKIKDWEGIARQKSTIAFPTLLDANFDTFVKPNFETPFAISNKAI